MRLVTRLVVVEECCGHQRLHETGHKTCCGGGGMLGHQRLHETGHKTCCGGIVCHEGDN